MKLWCSNHILLSFLLHSSQPFWLFIIHKYRFPVLTHVHSYAHIFICGLLLPIIALWCDNMSSRKRITGSKLFDVEICELKMTLSSVLRMNVFQMICPYSRWCHLAPLSSIKAIKYFRQIPAVRTYICLISPFIVHKQTIFCFYYAGKCQNFLRQPLPAFHV